MENLFKRGITHLQSMLFRNEVVFKKISIDSNQLFDICLLRLSWWCSANWSNEEGCNPSSSLESATTRIIKIQYGWGHFGQFRLSRNRRDISSHICRIFSHRGSLLFVSQIPLFKIVETFVHALFGVFNTFLEIGIHLWITWPNGMIDCSEILCTLFPSIRVREVFNDARISAILI
ncbi:hypothetical protein GQ457_14G016850 [Hibiscus cannabinus]